MKMTFGFFLICLFLQLVAVSPAQANHLFILSTLEKATENPGISSADSQKKISLKVFKKRIKEALKQRKIKRRSDEKRKTDWMGWVSLFSGGLGFNLVLYSALVIYSPALTVLGLLIIAGALTFGIISFIRIKKNPDKYKGAAGSLIVSILATFALIIAMIVAASSDY